MSFIISEYKSINNVTGLIHELVQNSEEVAKMSYKRTKIVPEGVIVKKVISASGREYEVAIKTPSVINMFLWRCSDEYKANGSQLLFLLDLRIDERNVYKVKVSEHVFTTKNKRCFLRVIDLIIKEYERSVYYESLKKLEEWDGAI